MSSQLAYKVLEEHKGGGTQLSLGRNAKEKRLLGAASVSTYCVQGPA